jgi:hypothetical protein
MTLTDPEYEYEWTVALLASQGQTANCGDIEIEFKMDVEGSFVSLDSDLFEVDTSNSPNKLKVLQSFDTGKVGVYRIVYQAKYV